MTAPTEPTAIVEAYMQHDAHLDIQQKLKEWEGEGTIGHQLYRSLKQHAEQEELLAHAMENRKWNRLSGRDAKSIEAMRHLLRMRANTAHYILELFTHAMGKPVPRNQLLPVNQEAFLARFSDEEDENFNGWED